MDHLMVIQISGFRVSMVMQGFLARHCDILLGPPIVRPVFQHRPSVRVTMTQDDAVFSPDWAHLIQAVAERRDAEAFEQLFAYFAPRIVTVMRRSGAAHDEAEELAQETMIQVWRKAGLFDLRATGASAWIFTIARNLRIDRFRRKVRDRSEGAIELAAEEVMSGETPADEVLAAGQREREVRTALAGLPQAQLRVVELAFFEDKAHGEIADALGLPLGTVKSRLRLAMEKLRTLLKDAQ